MRGRGGTIDRPRIIPVSRGQGYVPTYALSKWNGHTDEIDSAVLGRAFMKQIQLGDIIRITALENWQYNLHAHILMGQSRIT